MVSYLIGLCFLLLPFITFHPSYDAFEYPKVIIFTIIINCVLAFKLWTVAHDPKKYLRLNFTDKLLLLLTVFFLISWGINGFPSVSFWGQYYRYEGLLTLSAYLSFYFLISRFSVPKILHFFLCLSAFLFPIYLTVCSVLFQFFHLPVYTFYGRTAGTFGNPNFAAGFLALLFPYLLFYPRLRPIYKILLTPVFFTALIFTQSRSGLLAFLVVLILFLARKSKRALIAVFPISLLILAILIMLIPRYSPFENQLVIWQKALVAVTKKPVFGWGVERFDIAFQKTLIPSKDFDLYHIRVDKAHNEILETAVAGGLISALVYLVLITTTLIYLLKNHRSPWAKANLFAFVAYLILSQLNVLNVTEYLFFYLILASLSQSQSTDLKSPPTL